MQASTQFQIYYLNTIQTTLQSNCSTPVVLAPSTYQTNVYAPNWILGNQTIDDVVNQYVQRSQDSNSITNCPLSTPFFNGLQCINCTDPTPVFNIQTSKCSACPLGTTLNDA